MSQAIIRLDSTKKDAEICIKRRNKTFFKNISVEKLYKIIEHYNRNTTPDNRKIILHDESIIGAGSDYVVINQPECKKYVHLLGEGYKIVFPNSIYVLYHKESRVKNIKAYAYKEFRGPHTELYEYPMPNELSGNMICIGQADRKITDDNYVEALERIIAAEYSHATFTGITGFTDSKRWFEYLSKNDFPYKQMRKLNKKLGNIRV